MPLRVIESDERLFEALLKCAPLRSLCFLVIEYATKLHSSKIIIIVHDKYILMIVYYKSSFKNHNSKIYITVGRLVLSMIIWSNRQPS